MNNIFTKISPEQITENPFKLIGEEWMLITAGSKEKFNTMTASWGGLGVLWNKPVAFIFIRPQRYTREFVEANDTFTLSFFNDSYKKALQFCGTKSGKNVDKMEATGLTPIFDANENIYFEESRLAITCKKLYYNDIIPDNFINKSIDNNYPNKDYHRFYIGEIESIWQKTLVKK